MTTIADLDVHTIVLAASKLTYGSLYNMFLGISEIRLCNDHPKPCGEISISGEYIDRSIDIKWLWRVDWDGNDVLDSLCRIGFFADHGCVRNEYGNIGINTFLYADPNFHHRIAKRVYAVVLRYLDGSVPRDGRKITQLKRNSEIYHLRHFGELD